MWRSSFLVNLQACRFMASNYTNINSFTDIFQQHFNPLPIFLHPPRCSQHLWETLGYLPIGKIRNIFWEGNFYVVVGIWGGVILTIQTLFKCKKQHIVKILPVGVKVKFCREEEEDFFPWVVKIWGQGSGDRT